MNTFKNILIIATVSVFSTHIKGQDTLKMSLSDALKYAESNSTAIQNAATDVEISRQAVNQVTAAGLPQIGVNAGFMQYLQVPGNWVKNFVPSAGAPEYIFLRFQQPIASNATVSMNQLIYSGTFLLGLKAAREVIDLSRTMAGKTRNDVALGVSKAYLMALTLQKNITLINSNITLLEKSLSDVKALYKEGFAEKLDVQRLEFSLTNLKVSREKLLLASNAALNLLKIQIGMQVASPLILTDDLETLDKTIPVGDESFNINNRFEYQLLNQSLSISFLEEKRYKVGKYPTLVGFLQHQQTTQRPEFNFFNSNLTPNNSWVPSSAFGLNLSMTLFDGLRAKAAIADVKLRRSKTINDLKTFQNAANMEYENALKTYQTQLEMVAVQKQNVQLANNIYNNTVFKYKEGVGSALEMLQAETDLKTGQANYLNALYDLVMAKIDLKKALGNDLLKP
ncbi:MAG: TolC family protein [Sphingomonadales bacterium]|nr:TolC family protein [Sphingomonadales bacterium]